MHLKNQNKKATNKLLFYFIKEFYCEMVGMARQRRSDRDRTSKIYKASNSEKSLINIVEI